MVDVFERKKTMQWCINRRGDRIVAKRAEWIHLHHFIFEFHAAIALGKPLQLREVKRRKPTPLDASDVSAAPFNPKRRLLRPIEGIDATYFRTGVPSPKIRDAQIRSQDVGAVTEQLRRVQVARNALIP